MDRMTIHFALAVYLSDYPNDQIRLMARRYLQSERNSAIKRVLRKLIKDPNPSKAVIDVWETLHATLLSQGNSNT